MKRALILCLVFVLSETLGNCAAPFFPPLQPIGGGNSIQNYSSNVTSLSDPFARPATPNDQNLNQIEQSLFGHTFATQSISTRLSRIEKTLFTTTYPNSTDAQRLDNIISNFNQINKYPNISTNVLSKMESKVLSQSFPQYSAERRIERLEQQLFGAVQSGDLNSRYDALKIAAKNYNPNNNYNDPYAPNPMAQSGWKGLVGALGNSMMGGPMLGGPMLGGMGGTMTGFTPPISPYNNYGNNGYNNAYGNQYPSGGTLYRGVRTNHGYSDSFSNFGTGTGVTILD